MLLQRVQDAWTAGESVIRDKKSFPVAQAVKNLPAMQETRVRSLDREDPLEKKLPTSVFLPGEFHGQRSLVGYTPWGGKEVDTAK